MEAVFAEAVLLAGVSGAMSLGLLAGQAAAQAVAGQAAAQAVAGQAAAQAVAGQGVGHGVEGSLLPAMAIPAHGDAVVLFDGADLAKFDTFIRGRGLNADPEHVFTVENGVVHVSGHEMGYIVTKQAVHRFYLRAEFKWGEGTFGERKGQARDSGILYNIQGEAKVWPRSLEFQIKEGETGDFWLTDGAALTGADGKRVTGPPGSALNIGHIDKGPQENVVGFRNTHGEFERPKGEWNTLEMVVDDKTVRQYVNGTLANVGTDPFPTEGKVLFQSEGAEVSFRKMVLYPLK